MVHELMLGSGFSPDAPTAVQVVAAALQAGEPSKAVSLAISLQVRSAGLAGRAPPRSVRS